MPVGRSPRPCVRPWRRRAASGAVLTAVALGVRHAVDDRDDSEAVVVPADDGGWSGDDAVEVHFDGRGPAETWVVVRPWLLAEARR